VLTAADGLALFVTTACELEGGWKRKTRENDKNKGWVRINRQKLKVIVFRKS